MTTTIRMPVAVASRQGVSALAGAASEQRVLLTSHGRPVAIVDSAQRIDEDLRRVREAASAVTDVAADIAASRSHTFSLDDVCMKLGIDVEAVLARAKVKADNAC